MELIDNQRSAYHSTIYGDRNKLCRSMSRFGQKADVKCLLRIAIAGE